MASFKEVTVVNQVVHKWAHLDLTLDFANCGVGVHIQS
jgi:hypothetical protein